MLPVTDAHIHIQPFHMMPPAARLIAFGSVNPPFTQDVAGETARVIETARWRILHDNAVGIWRI